MNGVYSSLRPSRRILLAATLLSSAFASTGRAEPAGPVQLRATATAFDDDPGVLLISKGLPGCDLRRHRIYQFQLRGSLVSEFIRDASAIGMGRSVMGRRI